MNKRNSKGRKNCCRGKIKAKVVSYIINFRVQQKATKFHVPKPISKNKKMPNIEHGFFWDFDIEAMDFDKAYKTIIARIIERGGQEEVDELISFYGRDKIIKALKDEIYFLPNHGINSALEFFPELNNEEMYCYLNRKDKPYDWI